MIFTVSYIGFDKKQFKYSELPNCKEGETSSWNMELSTPQFSIPYLLITDYITEGIDLEENAQTTIIQPKKLGTLPGQTNPDLFRTAQFLPGISAPSSKASDIYIRGGTPDQNLIIWEEIPIYHAAHYFGMISAVDPYVVSKMKIYRSGFDASYGNRISGVIDIESFGDKYDQSFIGVGSDLMNAFLNGYQKLGKNKNHAITFSLRRSFANKWESPTFKKISKFNQQGLILGSNEVASNAEHIDIKNDFEFIDAHLKFGSQINTKTHLSLSTLYAINDFTDKIIDDKKNETQRDTMNLKNQGASLKIQRQWSQNFSSELVGTITQFNYKYSLSGKEMNEQSPFLEVLKSNNITDKQVQLNSNYKTNKNAHISFGYQFTNYNIGFEINEDSRRAANIKIKGKAKSDLHAAYLSLRNNNSKRFRFDAGLRTNYFNIVEKLFLEPRIKLSYSINEIFSLHGNFGKHHQFISQITEFRGNENGISTSLWALADDKGISIQSANQYQLGMIVDHNHWTIDLQAYQKNIKGLSSRAYNFITADPGNPSHGDANVLGLDILIKKRINKNLKFWASYTLSNIEMKFPKISPQPFNSDYDQRQVFKIASQFIWKQLQIALALNHSTGLPYTTIIDFTPINDPGEPWDFDINYGKINKNYLNSLTELNASISYSINMRNSLGKIHLTASFTNLFNKKNIYNRSYFVDAPKNQDPDIYIIDKINLQATPNLSVRFEF